MRLLDVETFEIKNFDDNAINENLRQCAIISHRWTDHEIDFQSFQEIFEDETKPDGPKISRERKEQFLRRPQMQEVQITDNAINKHKKGIQKAAQACSIARENDYGGPMRYVWFDTCCINKKDRQEHDHAIRSMFRWYQHSNACYAYLGDVSASDNEVAQSQSVRASEWFKRGWTLQELLAPREIYFFDRRWEYLGTKSSLINDISLATGIERRYLQGGYSEACIAVKMSWMTGRKTTYKEDIAYCLIGLFDIDMNSAYGEEERAFMRLQEELVEQISTDESIFAWTMPNLPPYGLLAPRPTCFSESRNIVTSSNKFRKRVPYMVLNRGIDFRVPNKLPDNGNATDWNMLNAKFRKTYKLKLNCWRGDAMQNTITIMLHRDGANEWRRVNCDKLDVALKPRSSSSIFGSKTSLIRIPHRVLDEPKWGEHGIHIFGQNLIES
ncbi:MAG: hypothetical protein M1820_009322 [Bogoriella megaspora]|nr:MAG: hypothetical protein M1820_009322 [Bogoriella megaspora]